MEATEQARTEDIRRMEAAKEKLEWVEAELRTWGPGRIGTT